jgi:hypothetical protein
MAATEEAKHFHTTIHLWIFGGQAFTFFSYGLSINILHLCYYDNKFGHVPILTKQVFTRKTNPKISLE